MGAKEYFSIGKQEEVRVHSTFRMTLVSIDEIAQAPRGRRDGQDGEIRKAIGFGMETESVGH